MVVGRGHVPFGLLLRRQHARLDRSFVGDVDLLRGSDHWRRGNHPEPYTLKFLAPSQIPCTLIPRFYYFGKHRLVGSWYSSCIRQRCHLHHCLDRSFVGDIDILRGSDHWRRGTLRPHAPCTCIPKLHPHPQVAPSTPTCTPIPIPKLHLHSQIGS